jgi:cytochrome c553
MTKKRRAETAARAARAVAAGAALTAVAGAASAQAASALPDRFELCASCHGAGGVSATTEVPSLAGQHSFYAITQLFLFRAGRRTNPVMGAVAKPMSDADLRAYSELIGKLAPAPPYEPAPADPARMARGAALAAKNRCASCHGDDYAGDQQVPRVAGQREDYLAKTLAEFKSGERVGYTAAMNETLAAVDAKVLPDLAHYLAHVGGGH